MKKIFAILLACAMFLPLLASCGTMQAGEMDLTVYDAQGNVQNVAYDASKITGYDASQVTGYQSVPGRNSNYLTSIDTTGGEYRGDGSEKYPKEGDSDPINATEDAQPVNLTGTFDTYYSRETWKYTYLEWFVECAATPGNITTDLGKPATDDYYPQYKGMLIYEIYTAEQYVSLMRLLNYTVDLGESEIHEDVSGAGYSSVTKKPWIDFSNKVFVLKRDLDFSKATSDVSYILSNGTSYFNGILDGEGHVIKGKTMTSSSSSQTASMFGVLVDATIKNIAFVDITLTDTSRKGASGLAKWCAGDVVIDNVYFQGSIIGGSSNTGGLIGTVYDSVTITNTTVDIEIGKDTHATGSTIGGLIGYVNTASVVINNCKVDCVMNVDSAITATTKIYDKNKDGIADQKNGLDMYVATLQNDATQYGGLIASCTVGADQEANIQNCEISGSIAAAGDRISGAVGRMTLDATATISNICSNVDLSIDNVTAYPVVPDGQVFCDKDGKLYGATEDHYKNLMFTQMGGVIGYKEGAGSFTVTKCTNTGDLSGTNMVGGIAGAITGNGADTTIQNCINTGNVTLTGDRSAGILANYGGNAESDLLVKDCKNEGNVTATMPYTNVGMFCGGIGGYWNGSKTAPIGSTTVSNCFSTGDITANRASGGLIGYFQHVKVITVEDCGVVADMKFTYDSTSNPYFGGLIGLLAEDGTATINNCTVAGYMRVNNKKTAGVVYAGGLIGDLRNQPTNGYFNSTNIPELGVGETYSNYTVTNCVVNLDFSKGEAEDTLEVILGLDQSGAYENDDLTVNISNVRYIAVDSAASTDNTEVGTVLTKTAHRTIKDIGKQKKQNSDGSYSLRYVFGVKDLSEFEVAMGFNVNIQFAGEAARTVTVYCPTLYTSIMSGSTEFTAAAAGVDYLFTLVVDNVPAEQIVVDGDTAYIKNGQINITPFTSVGESAGNRNGSTASVSKPIANMITLTQAKGDFSTTLPGAFADVDGLIPEVVYSNGLEDKADLGCVTVSTVDSTDKDESDVVFKDTCANEDINHHCAFTANGMHGLRDGNARYHYYTDLSAYQEEYGETLDVYDVYYTVSFYVAEDATYDFCFQLRLKDNTQRSLLIALDDAAFDDQFILTYKITDYTKLITSNTSGDATYRDSYIEPFSLELTQGYHTLTFRQPYDFNGVSGGSNMHIRDIYMVKAAD